MSDVDDALDPARRRTRRAGRPYRRAGVRAGRRPGRAAAISPDLDNAGRERTSSERSGGAAARPGRPGRRAALPLGACPPRTTWRTTTRSGAARSTATTPSSSGSAWRPSSPACPGSRSCAAARASAPPSPDFKISSVAVFTDADRERLLADAGIIRNRAKIDATIANARVLAELGRGRTGRADLVLRPGPGLPAGPADPRRRTGGHRRVDGPVQGPEEARAPFRRPHDRVRADAGLRPGRRPPGSCVARSAARESAAARHLRRLSGPGTSASPCRRTPAPRSRGPPTRPPVPGVRPPSPGSRPGCGRTPYATDSLRAAYATVGPSARARAIFSASAAQLRRRDDPVRDAQLVRLLRLDAAREEQQVGGAAGAHHARAASRRRPSRRSARRPRTRC